MISSSIIYRLARLFFGLFLYAVGIVMTINANLGLAPWDVFHKGLNNTIGITMGQASISVGFIIVVITFFLGERIGWGTVFNMYFIGVFMDILMTNNLIPTFNSFFPSLTMMLLGMFVIGCATVAYIGAQLGSGPRDSLMIALTKKTHKSVRFIRNAIEISVLSIGYLLGGTVGIGTVIMSLSVGYFIQFSFKLFKFDVTKIHHRYIDEDIIALKKRFFQSKIKNDT